MSNRLDRVRAAWDGIGVQTQFYARAIGSIGDAAMNYRTELIRLIATMGLGAGALAVVGGTVAIVGFLTMTTGALVAVQGYNQFASVGVEALTGFASAFFKRPAHRGRAPPRCAVGDHRRRRDRPVGGHAYQRGDRRT